MNETNEFPISIPDEDESSLVDARREKSREWVINTYRKHQQVQTSSWLDKVLGEGSRNNSYVLPILLDTNPIRHRQSIQEQVFPAPRIIHEDLLMTDHMKIMLEADCGMGKTTFAQAVAEFLSDNGFCVKTMERPRDLQVGPHFLTVSLIYEWKHHCSWMSIKGVIRIRL